VKCAHNVNVGELVQSLEQVDMATPDMTEQTTSSCSDAAGSQH